jgi:hypothetical protein
MHRSCDSQQAEEKAREEKKKKGERAHLSVWDNGQKALLFAPENG